MDNNNSFKLASSAIVNGITLDCYVQNGNNNPGEEFWLSREQIGRLLGYGTPRKAISDIHRRNRERLDPFSTSVKLNGVEGGRTVNRDVIVYNFKGLLEICRFSNQPKANEVMNLLWDIANKIRQKGYYAVPAVQSLIDGLKEQVDLLEKKASLLEAQNSLLLQQIEQSRSFVLLGQAITPMKGLLSAGEAAKLFAQKGFKIGQNRLLKKCRDKKILGRRKGRQWNQPTQKAIEQGYLNISINIGLKATPMFTPKGLQLIADWLAEENFPIIALIDKSA